MVVAGTFPEKKNNEITQTVENKETIVLRPFNLVKYSVDAPPGKIETRVFVGGNYTLMPIIREIEKIVVDVGFQPIVAYDFDIPLDKTRDYSLRLLFQCRYAIFESTLLDGHLVEITKTSGFNEIQMLQVYMALDSRKKSPKTMSIMVWQTKPPPQGYVTLDELRELIRNFLTKSYIKEKLPISARKVYNEIDYEPEEPDYEVMEPDYEPDESDYEPEEPDYEPEEPEEPDCEPEEP